jgi:hypothetical protein
MRGTQTPLLLCTSECELYETTRAKSFLVGKCTEFKPLVLLAWMVVQGTRSLMIR